jgi:Kdo2-lipid IVA lauroyltransferase/acyltransferase
MKALIYYLTFPLIWVISLLPFRLLYILSDFVYWMAYKVLKYRKEVVLTNLKNSFPEKTDQEIALICKKFYQFFGDLVVETIKTLTISPKTLKKHVKMDDISIFQKYNEQKQSVIIVMGHFGNWELAGARFSQEPVHQLYVIYHPLRNKYFDNMIYYMRTRLGNRLYAMNDTLKGMLANKENVTATAFIADQAPGPGSGHWMTFLNQETAVLYGTEKIVKKLNYPIIYIAIKRVKRGLYHIESELLFDKPAETKEYEITETQTRRLEQDILAQPELWLWTHKRWKHKRPQPQNA